MTDDELAELERLANQASPGPWYARDSARHPEEWAVPGTEVVQLDDPDANDFGWSCCWGGP